MGADRCQDGAGGWVHGDPPGVWCHSNYLGLLEPSGGWMSQGLGYAGISWKVLRGTGVDLGLGHSWEVHGTHFTLLLLREEYLSIHAELLGFDTGEMS